MVGGMVLNLGELHPQLCDLRPKVCDHVIPVAWLRARYASRNHHQLADLWIAAVLKGDEASGATRLAGNRGDVDFNRLALSDLLAELGVLWPTRFQPVQRIQKILLDLVGRIGSLTRHSISSP